MTKAIIRAAGGVVWRRSHPGTGNSDIEVVLVHRPRYDDWTLPKGKLHANERDVDGAVREVREETGYRVTVGEALGTSEYQKLRKGEARWKVVRWWSMEALSGTFVPSGEVDEIRWVPPHQADQLLTRRSDREILRRFADMRMARAHL